MSARSRLEEAAASRRVPLHGTIELTWRCNFACVHCYQEGLRETHRELTTAEWKSLLDELADAGCLFLTITGGEPLLRPDFAELYAYAHQRGFFITLFTNGALLDDELLDLLARMPPVAVELTLYGSNEAQYREVARRVGHAKVMRAIDGLVARRLPLTLKAVALRPLAGELGAMRELARQKGAAFRWDSSVTPRLDGNRAPQAYRLTPQEQLALDLQDQERAQALQTCTGTRTSSDALLLCGATKVAFNVDPSGHVSGCVLLRSPSVSAGQGFAAAWAELGSATPSKSSGAGCGACKSRSVCGRCPGSSQLEHGAFEAPIPHHCELTQLRFSAVSPTP